MLRDPKYEGQHFFSRGFVDGESLAERLRDGPLPPREAAELTRQTAEAVAYARDKGVIHRDLKPANVLLERQARRVQSPAQKARRSTLSVSGTGPSTLVSRPIVTDFGLAKKSDACRSGFGLLGPQAAGLVRIPAVISVSPARPPA